MMEIFVKTPVVLALVIAIVCHSYALNHNQIPQHHKVRHKHNILHFNDNDMNEIREAFDDFKSTIYKPKGFDDDLKSKSLRHHRKNSEQMSDDLTHSASDNRFVNSETSLAYPRDENSQFMTRYKRVRNAETTTHGKESESNYDDEYDDEIDEKPSRKASDGSVVKMQETATAGQKTLTDYKLEMLSTRDGIQADFEKELRNERNNRQEIADNYDQATIFKQIRENMMRTKLDGMCRWPNKKVIEMPQHASKLYTPRKFVIYQCSDDTACCGSNNKTCVAKKSEELVLWFHVRYEERRNDHWGLSDNDVGSIGYESLKVQNHTECQCLYKNSRQTPAQPKHVVGSRVSHTLPKITTTRPRKRHCKCPSHFDVEVDEDACGCFCRNGKPECRQRFEGREGFTISDQRCIKSAECHQPHCLYGTYSAGSGRCPDRNDKIRRGFQRPK